MGTEEDTYGLNLALIEEVEAITFAATAVPISVGGVHEYAIDWDALARGEKGVAVQIDSEGDGVFEQTIVAGATLQPPVADAGGPYTGAEGSSIAVDGSASYDPDGFITLYEWDFTGEGDYDLSSGEPLASWTWLDDYSGNVTVRVTDDVGLTATATAEVTVLNVAPTVDAGPDQIADEGNVVFFSGSFTDPGTADTHTIV